MSTSDPFAQDGPHGRHAEIDAAARTIAFSFGLSGITLRRLASTAGLSPGDIAAHEPSMTALVARTFEELAGIELNEARRDIAGFDSALEALRLLVGSLLEDTHGNFNSVWADAWSMGRHNVALARAARDNMTAWHELICSVVRRGMEGREFEGSDSDLVALQFLALIDSITAYSLVDYRTPAERSHLMRRTLEVSLGLAAGSL